jgi:hypothetical protein
MSTPQLHRQLLDQLSQWIIPKDQRHLKNCAEIVAAILQSESACLARFPILLIVTAKPVLK